MKKFIGIGIFIFVFAALFGLVAHTFGFVKAIEGWAISAAITAILVYAANLIFNP